MQSGSDHRRKKIIFAIPIAACIPTILIFLTHYNIQIPIIISVGFFLTWAICFTCDIVYTVFNKRMIAYEGNVVFSTLYAKIGLFSVPIQILVDLGFVLLVTIVVTGRLNFEYTSVVAVVFGLLHLDAYHSNRKFMRNFS